MTSAAVSEKAGGNHPGVVADEKVSSAKKRRKVAEIGIGELSRATSKVEHSGGSAVGGRPLGNEFLGQVKIEFRNEHEGDYRGLRIEADSKFEQYRNYELFVTIDLVP